MKAKNPPKRAPRFTRSLAIAGVTLTSLLVGCADCNILSSNSSTLCNVELAAGMVLLAPVMLPAIWIDDTIKDRDSKRRHKDMLDGVLRQDPVASEKCLLWCGRNEQDSDGAVYVVKAAQTVLSNEERRVSTDPRSAMLTMTAHQSLANAAWPSNPGVYIEELNRAYEAVPPTMDFTNVKLPRDESHVWDKETFSRQANELIENLLIQDQRIRYEEGQRKWVCDTSKFKALLTITGDSAKSVCRYAEIEWKSRLDEASRAPKKQVIPQSTQIAPPPAQFGAAP